MSKVIMKLVVVICAIFFINQSYADFYDPVYGQYNHDNLICEKIAYIHMLKSEEMRHKSQAELFKAMQFNNQHDSIVTRLGKSTNNPNNYNKLIFELLASILSSDNVQDQQLRKRLLELDTKDILNARLREVWFECCDNNYIKPFDKKWHETGCNERKNDIKWLMQQPAVIVNINKSL